MKQASFFFVARGRARPLLSRGALNFIPINALLLIGLCAFYLCRARVCADNVRREKDIDWGEDRCNGFHRATIIVISSGLNNIRGISSLEILFASRLRRQLCASRKRIPRYSLRTEIYSPDNVPGRQRFFKIQADRVPGARARLASMKDARRYRFPQPRYDFSVFTGCFSRLPFLISSPTLIFEEVNWLPRTVSRESTIVNSRHR